MRNYEKYERKRNIFIGFRLSKEEKEKLDKYVKLSGLTQRDYVAKRSMQEDVVIIGNTRVYKALSEQVKELISELKRLNTGDELSKEFIELVSFALRIYEGMNENENDRSKE